MTARSLHEIIGKTSLYGVSRNRVRRDSFLKGSCEARFWRPVSKRQMGPAMVAAEGYDRQHKQPGKRNGPLGHVGLEVLRALYRIVCHRSGRLEPSIDYLVGKLRRSRDAIVRALKALKDHGFLDWIRRTEPIFEAEGAGPRIRQVSNAYRLCIPAFARVIVERIIGPAPVPADAVQHFEQRRAEQAMMVAQLPLREAVGFSVSNEALAVALARLADALEGNERESA
ncbi:hypothetical protein [Sphingomonas sp. Leaf28]|uniref:hypothetical protein n=1 Tax=Sphingomonas sp. Leaf28 TaxID=1735695 RepID=UPI0006FF01FD|nr:hypothetical protein [Sphingomonas sp. Leaf28]KQN16123.1 hypothetical protein ASE79_05385 [Sphingomonas sp. Leaf28]